MVFPSPKTLVKNPVLNSPLKKGVYGDFSWQFFDQVFDQILDQGFGEGRNHKYSVQYYPA